jgi:hypothetical protein
MWKHIVDRGRPQMTHGACALHAGNLGYQTLKICNGYSLSHAAMFAGMCLNVTYTYTACLVLTL